MHPERTIVRHWQLVMLAFTFSLLVGALSEATSGLAANAPPSAAPSAAGGGEKSAPAGESAARVV